MIIPITGVIHLIDTLVFAFCAWRLNVSFIDSGKRNMIFKYFSLFFLFTAIFQLIIAIGHLPFFFGRPEMFIPVFNLAYIIGHAFLYLGMAYFIYVPSYIYFENSKFAKKFTKIYFHLIVLGGIVITVINIINPLKNAYVDVESGLTIFNVPDIIGKLIPLIVILSWGPAALLFLYKSVKLKGVTRFKSLFLGIGLIVIIVGGPMHDVARVAGQYLLADILTLAGFFLLFFGVFMSPDHKQVNRDISTERV